MTVDEMKALRPGDAVRWQLRGAAGIDGRVSAVASGGLVTVRWRDGETSTRHPDDDDGAEFARHVRKVEGA